MPERPADVVVGRALDWIGKQTGRFFGWVHVFDPHAPYRPPPEYLAAIPGATVLRRSRVRRSRARSAVRPAGVIAPADARDRHGRSRREPGRSWRADAWHVRLRIDAARAAHRRDDHARRPRRATSKTVVDASVGHMDILPTILDAVGLAPDTTLGGTSLREAIRSNRGSDRPRYFEAMTYNLTRGWAPLRGVLMAREQVHRPADRRAVRSRRPTPRKFRTSRRPSPVACRRCERHWAR